MSFYDFLWFVSIVIVVVCLFSSESDQSRSSDDEEEDEDEEEEEEYVNLIYRSAFLLSYTLMIYRFILWFFNIRLLYRLWILIMCILITLMHALLFNFFCCGEFFG